MIEYVKAVKCGRCGAIHDSHSDTFFTVHGNICLGLYGGIVGNNFDTNLKKYKEEEHVLKKIDVFCRQCLIDILKEMC